MCLARKAPKDGKDDNIRVRVTPEQKSKLVEYAERHYHEWSGMPGIGSSLCAGGSKRSPKLIWSFFGVYFSFSGTETTKNKHKFELKLSIQAS